MEKKESKFAFKFLQIIVAKVAEKIFCKKVKCEDIGLVKKMK